MSSSTAIVTIDDRARFLLDIVVPSFDHESDEAERKKWIHREASEHESGWTEEQVNKLVKRFGGYQRQEAMDLATKSPTAPQQADTFDCEVKFSRATLKLQNVPMDFDVLQEKIESAWIHFAVMQYSLFYCRQGKECAVSDTSQLRNLLSSADRSFTHMFKVKKECPGFSEYSYKNKATTALTKLKASVTEHFMIPEADDKFALPNPQELEERIDREAHVIQSDFARRRVICLSAGVTEYTKREFISPVLIGSLQLVDEILLVCEKKIVGSFGNGPVDYSLMYKNLNIVLTEAKANDLEGGMVQNLVQQEASHESLAFGILPPHCRNSRKERKRKYDEISKGLAVLPSYGIITDGDRWLFTVIEREPQSDCSRVYKSSRYLLQLEVRDTDATGKANQLNQIKEIVRRIVAICLKQKDLIDNNEQLKPLLSGSTAMTIEDSLVASLENTTKKSRGDGDEEDAEEDAQDEDD